MEIRRALPADVEVVGALIHALLAELAYEGAPALERARIDALTREVLAAEGRVWVLLAIDAAGEAAGVVVLNECLAIYAEGHFGEITELYVVPAQRSAGTGARLIEAAAALGRERGWARLEVGAPELPKWQRSVDFYTGCGFVEVGPRLKLVFG